MMKELEKLIGPLAKAGDIPVHQVEFIIKTAIQALTEAAGGWDEPAALAHYPTIIDANLDEESFLRGARWQFEADRARIGYAGELLKEADAKIQEVEARLAESEENLELMGSAKILCKEREDKLSAAEAKVKELEAEVDRHHQGYLNREHGDVK